jgi:hypothetical protein
MKIIRKMKEDDKEVETFYDEKGESDIKTRE